MGKAKCEAITGGENAMLLITFRGREGESERI
jgi:hypothetical protein